jgi:hypothetical protein
MSQHPTITLFAIAAALLGIVTLAPPAYAANVCDAAYQAGIKTIQAPHHLYSVTTSHGKPTAGETIFVSGIEYFQVNGQWKRSPMTPQDMIGPAREKLKTHPDVCTVAGDQSKDGQATTMYKLHNSENDVDQQVWVAKATGLMVHVAATFEGGKTMDARYDYSNVQPPAGIK